MIAIPLALEATVVLVALEVFNHQRAHGYNLVARCAHIKVKHGKRLDAYLSHLSKPAEKCLDCFET